MHAGSCWQSLIFHHVHSSNSIQYSSAPKTIYSYLRSLFYSLPGRDDPWCTPIALIAEAVTSTLILSTDTSLSCLCTSLAYQAWNLFFNSSFIGLLTEMSIGWSLSVQFAGTCTGMMLCLCRSDLITGVVCPRKPSNTARAGWDFPNFSASLFFVMKGTMILLMYHFIVSSFDQWLSLCQMSHPCGKDTWGWQRSVLPL